MDGLLAVYMQYCIEIPTNIINIQTVRADPGASAEKLKAGCWTARTGTIGAPFHTCSRSLRSLDIDVPDAAWLPLLDALASIFVLTNSDCFWVLCDSLRC